MSEIKEQHSTDNHNAPPVRVRLPGFITDEDIGLGDVLKRATTYLGIKPCTRCEQRATLLNRWITFSGKSLQP
jgi:hypothetical protein